MQVESSTNKSTALGVIPFDLSQPLLEKLLQLSSLADLNDESQSNWVEMTMVGETLDLLNARYVCAGDSMQEFISSEQARCAI